MQHHYARHQIDLCPSLRICRRVVISLALLCMPLCSSMTIAQEAPAPTELRISIYSSTALEIAWNRAVSLEPIVGYEIIRNDEVLGVFDVLSLFESRSRAGDFLCLSG